MRVIDCPGLIDSRQGYLYEATHEHDGHKIRVHIYRDCYAAQNRIYAEVWSPTTLTWNRVVTRDGSHMPSYVTTTGAKMAAVVEMETDLLAYVAGVIA